MYIFVIPGGFEEQQEPNLVHTLATRETQTSLTLPTGSSSTALNKDS